MLETPTCSLISGKRPMSAARAVTASACAASSPRTASLEGWGRLARLMRLPPQPKWRSGELSALSRARLCCLKGDSAATDITCTKPARQGCRNRCLSPAECFCNHRLQCRGQAASCHKQPSGVSGSLPVPAGSWRREGGVGSCAHVREPKSLSGRRQEVLHSTGRSRLEAPSQLSLRCVLRSAVSSVCQQPT